MRSVLLRVVGVLYLIRASEQLISGRAFDRFITIWLENQDYVEVMTNEHFAEMRRDGVVLSRYYANTHPSQPNYLAAIAGDYFGLNHDGVVRVPHNVSTVVDLFDWRMIPWKAYFEDLPGPGYMAEGSDGSTGNGKWDYVRKHNPFVSFDSINMNGTRLLNLQSFADFQRDFDAGQLPQFMFMVPNLVHDGHNSSLPMATAWARSFLKPLLAEGALTGRTLVLLTFDEARAYDRPNHVAPLLLGSALPRSMRGTTDPDLYTHYSILASLEYNWAMPSLGRYDAGANVFRAVGELTGFKNREPPNLKGAGGFGPGVPDNSVSYPGPLNSDPARRTVVWPAPNIHLVGIDEGVLRKVRLEWPEWKNAPTPYDGSGRVFDGRQNLPVYGEQIANDQT